MPAPVPPASPWGPQILPPTWTLSEWQHTTRQDPLVNHGKDDHLPDKVDIVVIGSGLAGAKTAHALLSSSPEDSRPSLVILEARETCSGASGRNAGHCRPDAFRGFTAFSKIHGKDEAGGVLMSESITLDRVKDFVKEHDVDCEFIERMTLDVVLNEEFKDYCQAAMREAKEHGLDVSHIKYFEGADAKKVARSPRAIAAYQWPAASLNPSKLCYAVHRVNLSLGAKLFTWTPVTNVTEASSSDEDGAYKWKVETSRGSIVTKKVVYATNGYTSLILPEMDGLIVSHKAQAIKLTPPPLGMDAFPRIEETMSLRYLDRFYSVMQRPDNSIVLAAPRKWPSQDPSTFASLFGTYDDSQPLAERTANAYSEFCETLPGGGYRVEKDERGLAKEGHGGLDYSWSGILGVTPDNVPFLGAIPGKKGQYIIAGFNGHGMARIFHLAPCLAKVIKGEGWDETVPRCFEVTQERLEKLKRNAGKSKEINIVSELEEKAKGIKI
ncbi:hypothetical protein AYX14_02526 [Cryptococcus neoformans]|nr:hypothetical protein AYX15_02442 [Cryptococcus neoformans var. grubii]OWZ72079.1 hypothetical protein AYX14_02526 [Cryptococcus neoformans var. grubii]